MPRERPTRTESIFVRSNVLPPLRPAPFLYVPFLRHLARTTCSIRTVSTGESLASFSPWLVHSSSLHGINVINCSGSRYWISIRDEMITLPGERTELVCSASSKKRELAKEIRALKAWWEMRFFAAEIVLSSIFFRNRRYREPENLSGGWIINLFNSRNRSTKMILQYIIFFSS